MINLPTGSIITVPCNSNPQGYSDIDERAFPKVKAGEIKLNLFGSVEYPTWKEWHTVGHLSQYPELECTLKLWVQELPLGEIRTYWEKSLQLGFLPDIETLFFGISKKAGLFINGKAGGQYFYPMIEHTENVLRPIGQSTQEAPKETFSSVIGENVEDSTIPANFVLLAQRKSIYNLKSDPMLIQAGSGTFGYPAHLTTEIWINTQSYYPSLPYGYKYMIKD